MKIRKYITVILLSFLMAGRIYAQTSFKEHNDNWLKPNQSTMQGDRPGIGGGTNPTENPDAPSPVGNGLCILLAASVVYAGRKYRLFHQIKNSQFMYNNLISSKMRTIFRFSIWTAIIMIASTVGASAQNAFFPTKAGTVLVYAQKNAKGNPDSYSKTTIKNVEGSGNNMTISYTTEILDKNKKSANPPEEVPLKAIIKNGVMYLDMKGMFAGQMKDQQIKMEITGVPMELPSNMQPGQSLKDADVTLTMDLGIMKMKTTMKMTDGKCVAIEGVATPAGTFTCHKITQTVSITVMDKTSTSKSVSWYAKDIGAVKTETYSDKDILQGSTELVALN